MNAAMGLLCEVGPADPVTFASMVILTLVALVAGYAPARRASRADRLWSDHIGSKNGAGEVSCNFEPLRGNATL